jgi:CheY-like chemotaxis protein
MKYRFNILGVFPAVPGYRAGGSLLSQKEKRNITRKKTALAVDDSAEYLLLVTKILVYRYTTLLAKSGADALRLLARKSVDVILLDVEMPGISGLELFNALKEHPVYRTVPVIFVTAHAHPDIAKRAIELGAYGYIVKPFKEQALLSKIQKAVKYLPGKMAQAYLCVRLMEVEKCLEAVRRLGRQETDSDAPNPSFQDLHKKARAIFEDILREPDYIFTLETHLRRIYRLMKNERIDGVTKNERPQSLEAVRKLIDELDVKDMFAPAAKRPATTLSSHASTTLSNHASTTLSNQSTGSIINSSSVSSVGNNEE